MKNKNGQFFIIAALVIIATIISVVTISNYTTRKEVIKLYDLGEELGIESQQVLDFGTYNALDEDAMKTLMENFIKNYVDYMEEDRNIYFVFGNKNKINLIGYQEISPEEVEVCFKEDATQQVSDCSKYDTVRDTKGFTKSTGEITTVVIRIEDLDYEFGLEEGENFYFVIWQIIGKERHVVTSETEA